MDGRGTFLLPLFAQLAIGQFGHKGGAVHALEGRRVSGEHARRAGLLDFLERGAVPGKSETFAHALDHQSDLVVDRGLGEIKRHQGIEQAAHDDEIDPGKRAHQR